MELQLVQFYQTIPLEKIRKSRFEVKHLIKTRGGNTAVDNENVFRTY
jgi:hypothetical protein